MTLQNVVTSYTNQQQTQSLDQHQKRANISGAISGRNCGDMCHTDGSGGCGGFWKMEPEQTKCIGIT
jgi:hypothetical protein